VALQSLKFRALHMSPASLQDVAVAQSGIASAFETVGCNSALKATRLTPRAKHLNVMMSS
jgi:hypothetical protein